MLQQPTSSAAALKTQFTIISASAGDSGAVYTVPEGKNFTGYFYMYTPNNSNYTQVLLNGSALYVGTNITYGNWYAFPIYLSSGDVVANSGTHYFTLTGYEE